MIVSLYLFAINVPASTFAVLHRFGVGVVSRPTVRTLLAGSAALARERVQDAVGQGWSTWVGYSWRATCLLY